jgi:hypothetical protein
MTPNTIQFSSTDSTWVMRITADRRIEVNENVEVTEAAQKVLDAMQHLLNPAPVQATMKLESSGPGHGPAPNQKLSVRHFSLIDAGKTAAQPAVPDAIHHTDLSESLEYIQGWNDCRQAMLEMMK